VPQSPPSGQGLPQGQSIPPGQGLQPGQALPQAPGGQHPSLPPIPGAAAWHGTPVADDNALRYHAVTGNASGYGNGPASAQLANGFPGGNGYAPPNGNGQDRASAQAGILPQGQPALPGAGSFNGTQNGQYAPQPDANGPVYGTPAPFNAGGLSGTPSYPGMAGYPSPGTPASAPQGYPNAQQPQLMPESQFAQPQAPVQQSAAPPSAPLMAPQAPLLQAQSPVIHPLSTQPPTVRLHAVDIPPPPSSAPQVAGLPVAPPPIGQPAGLPAPQPQVMQYPATPEAIPAPQVPHAPALSPRAPAPRAQAPVAAAPRRAEPAGASAGPVSPPPSRTPAVSSLIESALASQSGSTVRGRRAARKPRLAMSAVFADLVDMANIPRSAYAVDDEVTGSMCLFKADGGYEVFSCAEDARHEVRFFEDEEAAYFYLFGVLAAEALRNGRLKPAR
jgi:hypothetical protein